MQVVECEPLLCLVALILSNTISTDAIPLITVCYVHNMLTINVKHSLV